MKNGISARGRSLKIKRIDGYPQRLSWCILRMMLRFPVFLYDVFRFVVFSSIFAAVGPQNVDETGFFLSNLLYAAPLTLFPLMSFFIWFDVKKYHVFLYLYTAGKIISIFTVIVSIAFSIKDFLSVFLLLEQKQMFFNLVVPALAFLDLFSIIPALYILSKKNS